MRIGQHLGSNLDRVSMTRRQMLKHGLLGLGVAVLPLLTSCGESTAQPSPTQAPAVSSSTPVAAKRSGRIVYATWGGSWEEAMRKAWFEPFTQKTGIEVVTVQGPDYGKIQAMVEAGKTEWDVAEVNPDFVRGVGKNLVEPIDWSVLGNKDDVLNPEIISDLAAPQVAWAMVLTYNTNAFPTGQHPTTWAEVWDVQRFPGKRAFGTEASGGIIECALLADGVEPDALYPCDVDRALRSLDRIRDYIIWYETGAQQVQYWKDQQAVLGLGWDGRVLVAMEEGAPVAIEYNQSQLTWSEMIIPKGAPNKDLAMEFLAYTFTPEAQAAIAMAMPYGPLNRRAYALIPPDRARLLSGGPQMEGKYIVRNELWWAENLEWVTEKFNAWRLGG